jgi:hypothetical protein
MSALNRAQILRARSPVAARVAVPEWAENGTAEVCIRSIKLDDFWHLAEVLRREREGAGEDAGFTPRALASICQAAVCDENGQLLFAPEDLPQVEQLEAAAVRRIAMEALRVNGLLGERSDIAKNSPPSPSDA